MQFFDASTQKQAGTTAKRKPGCPWLGDRSRSCGMGTLARGSQLQVPRSVRGLLRLAAVVICCTSACAGLEERGRGGVWRGLPVRGSPWNAVLRCSEARGVLAALHTPDPHPPPLAPPLKDMPLKCQLQQLHQCTCSLYGGTPEAPAGCTAPRREGNAAGPPQPLRPQHWLGFAPEIRQRQTACPASSGRDCYMQESGFCLGMAMSWGTLRACGWVAVWRLVWAGSGGGGCHPGVWPWVSHVRLPLKCLCLTGGQRAACGRNISVGLC